MFMNKSLKMQLGGDRQELGVSKKKISVMRFARTIVRTLALVFLRHQKDFTSPLTIGGGDDRRLHSNEAFQTESLGNAEIAL